MEVTKNNYLCVGAAVLAATLLAACGEAAKEPPKNPKFAACEASIKSNLLNPETAQILDMTEVPRDQVRQLFVSTYAESAADAVFAEDPNLRLSRGYVVALARDEAEEKFALDTDGLFTYNTFRVRAEGKLGNTITKQGVCTSIRADVCSCIF